MAQFNEKQVLKIRDGAAAGVDYTKLAEQFECPASTISSIARGATYKAFAGALTRRYAAHGQAKKKKVVAKKKAKKKRGSGNRVFTDEQVLDIRTRVAAGVSAPELSEEFGVASVSISSAARGATYPNVGGPLTSRDTLRRKLPDLATLSIDDASTFLQALSIEWPKIRASFAVLDELMGGAS